jgi:hypothetical protein
MKSSAPCQTLPRLHLFRIARKVNWPTHAPLTLLTHEDKDTDFDDNQPSLEAPGTTLPRWQTATRLNGDSMAWHPHDKTHHSKKAAAL